MKRAIITKQVYCDLDPAPLRVTEIYILGILVFRRKNYVKGRSRKADLSKETKTDGLRALLTLIFLPHVLIRRQRLQIKRMRHDLVTSEGLWCIDRHPSEVTKEWIEEQAFQLHFNHKDTGL